MAICSTSSAESCGLVDFRDVADEARRFLSLPRSEPESDYRPHRSPAPTGSPESARRLFAMSKPIAGTIVETYLRERGITDLHGIGACDSTRAATIGPTPTRRPRSGPQ